LRSPDISAQRKPQSDEFDSGGSGSRGSLYRGAAAARLLNDRLG
jgi:hypothetical protein